MATEAQKALTGSMDRYEAFIKPYQEKETQALEAKAEVETAKDVMQAGREVAKAKGASALEKSRAQGLKDIPSVKQTEELVKESATPFVPTKETAGDMAQLFALTNIVGFAMGAGGKRHAQAAMSGMNGMMEGYQKGRMDLYKKEKDIFETNMKQLKSRIDLLDKLTKNAKETLQSDFQAGVTELDMAYAQTGADFLRDMQKKVGVARTLEHVSKLKSNADRLWTEKTREEERARAQAFRERQAVESAGLRRQGLDIQRQMLQLRMDQASKSAESKNLKPPPKEIVAQNQLRNNIIPKLEESLPVLARLNKEGSWNTMTALLAVDPRAAELKFKDDPEALNLILTLAYFRSKEFETAGKALTKKEDQILAPIVRGDLRVYEGIKNAMEQGLKSLKQEQKGLEGTYPFIKEFNRAMRGETEDSGASSSTPSKYSIGQVIKRGNKSYRVTGLSDPNNPDVEEVK